MRLKARQTRFLIGTLAFWIAARAAMLAPWQSGRLPDDDLAQPPIAPRPVPAHGEAAIPSEPPATNTDAPRRPPAPSRLAVFVAARPAARDKRSELLRNGTRPAQGAAAMPPAPRDTATLPVGPPQDAPFTPSAPPPLRVARSRWAAEAYLFARPGSGLASLAAGGTLGGSQAAARLTYRLNRVGPVRTALAARFYAPLSTSGAEAAVGVDWHPLPRVPLRFSVERRVALDDQGRNAWSAYAAGGFYREPIPGILVVDGYAQAGVVGAHRRDLFVDGAVRAGRRLKLGPVTATVGAGLWGAAQPGVSRIDTGPRIGLVLPFADHAVSLAVEGRLRVAGRANPGSGAALTLGVDL